jgi:membrane protein implicated in regulation of membrane protease activity
MCDPVIPLAMLAGTSSVFLAAYWICLIVGGGLLVLSLIAGHGHHDVDTDAATGLDVHPQGDTDAGDAADHPGDFHVDTLHADLGHADAGHVDTVHGHAEAASHISTWLSIRFAVFFLAVFGAVGVILTHMTTTSPQLTLGLAVAGGALVGQAVHHLFRLIRRTSGDSTPQLGDYVNRLARVTIGIKPPEQGEVVLHVRGGEHYVPAVSGRGFTVGDEVVVVSYRAGVAEVVSRTEYEQKLA